MLVTGAGGPAGVSVIRMLRGAGHRVVAGDSSPDAVGLRLADAGVILPAAGDPGFTGAVCSLVPTHGVDAVVATVAEELVALARGSGQLDASGVAHWLPEPESVEACIDKWRFHRLAAAAGVAVPATALGSAEGVPGPWIVKPRWGRGSRDVAAVDDPDDFPVLLRRTPDPLVQHRLEGREFTVDVLAGRDGSLAGAVPRWRLATKAGISVFGETFAHEALVEQTGVLLGALGLRGPANVQGFVSGTGAVSFTEVNPRFSGGLPLSLAAGSDLVGQYLRGIRGLDIEAERLSFRPGVRMLRFHEEIFEEAPAAFAPQAPPALP